MATAVIQFRVKPSGGSYGAVQTGSAALAAEDEVQLQAASYSGWRSARWEIVECPAGYPAPSGWSTDASGVYYYNASSISGITPPPFTMPTTAQIAAGRWGKWLCRVVVTTSSGPITSDPRVGMKIESPNLALNGIGFTEENEFNTQRAYPGELQEDLIKLDDAALGGGADATTNFVTDSASIVNASDRPAQALPATLEFIRAGGAAIGAQHTTGAGSAQTALFVRRGITGGGGANAGTGVQIDYTIPNGLGVVTVAARARSEWTSVLAGTVTSKMVWSTVASGSVLTDWITLGAAGDLRLHAYTSAGALVVDGSGNITSTGATPAAASITLTAGAGLTGGGDLSTHRTFNVAAADASITVNADSIEASGAFGAKNISTTGSITAGSGSIATTITGVTNSVRDNLATTPTAGRRVRNTTASTAIVTVQLAPSDEHEGHARVSGADVQFLARFRLIPRTNGATDVVLEYSTNNWSTTSELQRWTTLTSGQFVAAAKSYGVAFDGNGVFHDVSGSGMFVTFGGRLSLKSLDIANPMHLQADGGLVIELAAAEITANDKGKLQAPSFASESVVINHAANGAVALDLRDGQHYEINLTANITALTLSSGSDFKGVRVVLVFAQDAPGGRTVTFGTGFEATTAMGAALSTLGSNRTSYEFLVGDNGYLKPVSAPYVWAS